MMNLAMNFDTDECSVTAMFDKGNRNDTMEAIDHIIPFLKGDADIGYFYNSDKCNHHACKKHHKPQKRQI